MKEHIMKKYIYISLSFLLLVSSCERLFMESSPETTNTAIFEEYWKIVNEKFAMFDDPGKRIDRSKLYSENKALVNNSISKGALFSILGNITLTLKDGHSTLKNLERSSSYFHDIERGHPRNLDQGVVDQNYLINAQSQGDGLKYTLLDTGRIGYIQYRDFEKKITTEMINKIISYFGSTNGIILDVRANGGGDPGYAALLASHFTNSSPYIGYERFKTGPGINDFSSSKLYLKPASGKRYTKPLMVLTSVGCYSATSTLIAYLNPLEHVTFIGDTTGGGTGSVADGFLANGWKWQLSTSEFIDWNGGRFDNGFAPDIQVDIDPSSSTDDAIIDRAIFELKK